MDVNNLKSIKEYPEISFMKSYTMEQLADEMLSWFKEKRKELTGEDIVLGKADDRRIMLLAGAYFIYQGYMYMDDAGKMGLLKYSRGDYLENLGALKHIYRKPATPSTTTLRFEIIAPRTTTINIPRGTRVTAGDGVYFATTKYEEIKIGNTFVDIPEVCTTTGAGTNNYDIGDISTIVDLIAFVDRAKNITKPENGADIETDESLRQRIYIAPASYSTAGSIDSYEFFARQYSADITNVRIISPSPGVVEIRYLLRGGVIPEAESIKGLKEYLSGSDIRPLTDKVEVIAPAQVKYTLNLTYYINSSDQSRANTIQGKVTEAINEYIKWQRSEIGRDINPDVLKQKIIEAGAKRADIISPIFTVVDSNSVAGVETQTVTYGGLESD